ncbi:DUF6387 family protein [Burkholderia vietnamiensis]|uniref:DUF6387 family protein n=1 Tax=Burkholderia vietnamiensis TaxID=60552 RepID=UPI001CF5657F|nr:DUF6387 family protein [Burkholderia vietnamiensis]MCA8147962.1 DUF6387 family protein [Burkholderia vietnamiensis]
MPAAQGKVGELPAEFDVKNYDACLKFDATDWALNLNARYVDLFLRSKGIDVDSDIFLSLKASRYQSLAFSLENPIVPRRIIKRGEESVGPSHISDVSAYEVLDGYSGLDGRYNEYFRLKEAAERSDENGSAAYHKLRNKAAWEMHVDCGARVPSTVKIHVDLESSDEKLVSDFRAWLAETRRRTGITVKRRRFSDSDFYDWAEKRILAYLDLKIWQEKNHIRLTNHLVGVALFPDEFDVALSERVRKVVAPLAEFAIAQSTITALYSQVMSEQPEMVDPDAE